MAAYILKKSAVGCRVDLHLSQAFAGQNMALSASDQDVIFHVCFANDKIANVEFTTNPGMPGIPHVLERVVNRVPGPYRSPQPRRGLLRLACAPKSHRLVNWRAC